MSATAMEKPSAYEKLGLREKIGYGMGDAGSGMIWSVLALGVACNMLSSVLAKPLTDRFDKLALFIIINVLHLIQSGPSLWAMMSLPFNIQQGQRFSDDGQVKRIRCGRREGRKRTRAKYHA